VQFWQAIVKEGLKTLLLGTNGFETRYW
jgi:hypothetical protein